MHNLWHVQIAFKIIFFFYLFLFWFFFPNKLNPQFVFYEITLQTLQMYSSQSCPLGAFISFWKQHSSDLPAIMVSGERIPKDKFKSTNAAFSLWSGPLCCQHSAFMKLSGPALAFSGSTSKFLFCCDKSTACFVLSVFWKVLLPGGWTGNPRKKGNGTRWRKGSFASFPILVKSFFHGSHCESCCLQGWKQTSN